MEGLFPNWIMSGKEKIKTINNNLRHKNCPLCSSNKIYKEGEIEYDSPLYFSTHEIFLTLTPELWKCNDCKSGFIQNVIPEEVAAHLYKVGAAENRWPNTPEMAKTTKVFKVLDSLYNKNKNVLDIGCNTGELLDLAKAKGCTTSGVEYCLNSLQYIKGKGHTGYSRLDEVEDKFDVITAFDLFEHIYDVASLLSTCYDKLSTDGRLVFLTGDISCVSGRFTGANWWYLKYPEHIVFPSKEFFSFNKKYLIDKWVHTYAYVGFKNPFSKLLRSSLIGVMKGKYTGLPSIGPDHILVVLKKND